MLGLGNLLYQRAKYEDAEKAIRKAMSIRQIALGATHPSFAEAGMPKEPSKTAIEYSADTGKRPVDMRVPRPTALRATHPS